MKSTDFAEISLGAKFPYIFFSGWINREMNNRKKKYLHFTEHTC